MSWADLSVGILEEFVYSQELYTAGHDAWLDYMAKCRAQLNEAARLQYARKVSNPDYRAAMNAQKRDAKRARYAAAKGGQVREYRRAA